MRDTAETAMPDECTIVTVTLVSDSAGGHTETTSTATRACRLSPDNTLASESTIGDRVSAEQRWIVTVPYDAVVAVKDRIEIGTRSFDVVAVDTDRTWDMCKRVRCVEVL